MRRSISICILIVCTPIFVHAAEVQPGLIGEFSDGSTTVREIVPTANFTLNENESISTQIGPMFSAKWTGLLRLNRGGEYSIYGASDIRIDGKRIRNGEPVALSAGDHTIAIKTTRTEPNARQQLKWKSSFFSEEPIPSAAFGHHIPLDDRLNVQRNIAHGRFLFAEYGCGNCHESGAWNLAARRGPDLSDLGARVDSKWVANWLADPRHYRPASVMPVTNLSDQQRRDLVAFLQRLAESSFPESGAKPKTQSLAAGEELFNQVGCIKCHDQQNNLDSVGLKYRSPAALAQYIGDPKKNDAHGRMPQLFDMATESHLVQLVAEYLYYSKTKSLGGEKSQGIPPTDGDAKRGRTLFASSGCANCHSTHGPDGRIDSTFNAPAFAASRGLPLRHYWNFDSQVDDQVGQSHGRISGTKKFGPAANVTAQEDNDSAFEFDGTNFIEVNHFPRPNVMTISVWIKTEHGGEVISWARPGGGIRGSRELRINIGQDGKNSVCYGEYNSDGGWRPVIVRPTDVNLLDNQWHHLAVVRNGPSVQHYIDGKPAGKGGTVQQGDGDYTDRLIIGALGLQANPSNRFRGSIDDVSIWQMAMSAEQISQLAKGTAPLKMARPHQATINSFRPSNGCLADKLPSGLPNFQLAEDQRNAIRQFLASVQPDKPIYHAPRTTFDLRIRQFRCIACHQLDGQNIQAAQRIDDDGRIVRVEHPPQLTGVGDRLTVEWLQAVLVEKRRNRPWLRLRMPHFGQSVAELPALFSKTSGATLVDQSPRPDLSLAAAGIATIGEQQGKVACIACHNYRGINRQTEGVVPAPDLAEAGKTVRGDWFRRWLHNPTRLQPGTSMPQFFLDLSADDRERKIEELWSALVHQDKMPLPDGLLNKQTDGTRILVGKHPILFRMATKTPVGQINRAINVGLPGGSNFTFDAETCSLRFAWQGAFIDAGPAWNGRGGNPVTANGHSLFQSKGDSPLRIGSKPSVANIQFLGYRLFDKHPVFRYQLDGKLVEHRIDIDNGLISQTFVIHNPGNTVQFVGESNLDYESNVGTWDGAILSVPSDNIVRFKVTSQPRK
jgi:cbb3-type cytochrome oxidase cytochrome c subunit